MGKDIKSVSLGEPRRISAGLTNHEHPAAAPGGELLAYYAGPFGNIHIYVCDMKGRLARSMSGGPGNNTQAAWSPDGLLLAWRHQDSPEDKWQIWQAEVFDEEKEPSVLLADPQWHYKHPCYSPDGERLAYFSDEGSANIFHIWQMDLKSGIRSQLTFGDSQNHSHPVYSPDGLRVIFHAYEGTEEKEPGITNIYELDLATGELRQLTRGTDQYKHPFYFSDSLITYHHEFNETGIRRLCAMELENGREFELTSGENNDKHPFPFEDGDGKPHLLFASKKLGSELEGEGRTYDIFLAELEIKD